MSANHIKHLTYIITNWISMWDLCARTFADGALAFIFNSGAVSLLVGAFMPGTRAGGAQSVGTAKPVLQNPVRNMLPNYTEVKIYFRLKTKLNQQIVALVFNHGPGVSPALHI